MTKPATTRNDLFVADFVTIFSHMWYQDFPLQYSVREKAQRADWTIHIGITVRSTADLMGLFTHFESGGRTDALLRDFEKVVAALEWEWLSLHRGPAVVNEFDKLKERCASPGFQGVRLACLVGYARETSERGKDDYTERTKGVLEGYRLNWTAELPPLLLVAIHFEWKGKDKKRQSRLFTTITFDQIGGGDIKRLREQPAYPWNVPGSRWAHEENRGDK